MFQPDQIVFDRYKVIERIAFGAFSLVYRVIDHSNNQIVCLKIEKIDEDGQTMLKHEFSIAKNFNSNFLCRSFDFFDNHEIKGMTMELLEDNLANTRRKRGNPPSIPMLTNIALQCLKGLNEMHEKNFVHSDVKPSNFAFRIIENGNENKDYCIVTYDFGLSQYDGEDSNITEYRNNLVRNPRYLSLDTHNTNKWTKTDDIYALIYSLSDFWNDSLPWDGRTTHKLVYEIKNGYELKKLLPEELHILIDSVKMPTYQIIEKVEEVLLKMKRNIDQELHYLCDPKDPGLKPKLIKYVFEEKAEKTFTNQHSA
ncbi:CK1 family protein kinase [Tritrichomonas foetus]|uniref:CK1 family protein kinase n=1 Tax=Tritrichomonas foetus TaxID=1144522 RepID=A0A1J4J4H9_9EUKA|nr:CK1 family protein kinase [Tritrichomonas foetus]|eukprot:OHS93625.1 CK1 family protein kinase [Tritrichomonas foetus]